MTGGGIDVPGIGQLDQAAAPGRCKQLGSLQCDERIICTGHHHRTKRKLSQSHGAESGWTLRVSRCFHVTRSNQKRSHHPAVTISVLDGLVSHGCACRAVSRQHHRAVDTSYRIVQRSYPVRAPRCLPIVLLNPMVLRVLGSPNTLPVLRARIRKSGND